MLTSEFVCVHNIKDKPFLFIYIKCTFLIVTLVSNLFAVFFAKRLLYIKQDYQEHHHMISECTKKKTKLIRLILLSLMFTEVYEDYEEKKHMDKVFLS